MLGVVGNPKFILINMVHYYKLIFIEINTFLKKSIYFFQSKAALFNIILISIIYMVGEMAK
jgi:hypothetical protein